MATNHSDDLADAAQVQESVSGSPSRREILAGLAALGVSSLLPIRDALAAGAPAVSNGNAKRHIIDVHHHMMPPKYAPVIKHEFLTQIAPGFASVLEWTPKQSLEVMDQAGVQKAIVSVTDPGVWIDHNVKEGRKLARICNEYGAQLAKEYPTRFGFFAAIPLPDTEGSLKEIEYSLDVLKADGIGLFSDYNSKYCGDPAFAKVFDELNRRKAVVYIHPTSPACCMNLVPEMTAPIVEYPFDTTRNICSLLYSGTLTRCPDIKFIFSHGGGTLPFLASRIESIARRKDLAARLPKGPAYELKRLYVDTASITNPPAFAALLKFVSVDQVLFGTDYPFLPIEPQVKELGGLGLTQTEMVAIEHGNAMKMFPQIRV